MVMNPEHCDLQLMVQKSIDGTITLDEVKLALTAIRKHRESAQHVKAKKKTKPKVDTESLLGELL